MFHRLGESEILIYIFVCFYSNVYYIHKAIQTYDMKVSKSGLGSRRVDLTHVLTLEIREEKTFNFLSMSGTIRVMSSLYSLQI